jgi:alkylated DNA repair dioxygenase AlkB
METLFPIESFVPGGFVYIPVFLSEPEESKLLSIIASYTLKPLIFQGFEAKRKIISFGTEYHFDSRKITPGKPIPEEFEFLLEKVSKITQVAKDDFKEMLLTEYPPGSVINWHRDGPPFELIVGISLLSDCILKFRPYDKSKQGRSALLRFPIAKRSLYILKGESRNDWEHSIQPLKEMRYSITLRTLRKT